MPAASCAMWAGAGGRWRDATIPLCSALVRLCWDTASCLGAPVWESHGQSGNFEGDQGRSSGPGAFTVWGRGGCRHVLVAAPPARMSERVEE